MAGIRRRRKSSVSSDESLSNKSLNDQKPRIAYAKRKKADNRVVIGLQIFVVIIAVLLVYYTYYHFNHFHFHLTHFFAHHWDDHNAQHVLAHKLLKDRTNTSGAFHWFRRSADKGHPHSAYNLAAGHLSGFKTDVQKGEVRKLLKFAAKNGVEEAKTLLKELCRDKPKYCDL